MNRLCAIAYISTLCAIAYSPAYANDSVRIEPSNEAGVAFVLVYENSPMSYGGSKTIDSPEGPIAFHIQVTEREETFTIRDWPQTLLPDTLQVDVPDGDEFRILFRQGMM